MPPGPLPVNRAPPDGAEPDRAVRAFAGNGPPIAGKGGRAPDAPRILCIESRSGTL